MSRESNIEIVESISLRPYKCAQLCTMYQVTKKTFLKWIAPFAKEIGQRRGHFFTVRQVQTIFIKLGLPGKILSDTEYKIVE